MLAAVLTTGGWMSWRGRRPLSITNGQATHSDDRLDPSLTLYFDESGNGNAGQPLIVGAVACDTYTDEPEELIRALYDELANRGSLVGLPSFEGFVKSGFHASENPFEVAGAFRELVQQKLHLKAYMIMTDRTSMSPTPESEQLKELYAKLVTDIVLNSRHRVSVSCIFEQNEELRRLVSDLPHMIVQRASETTPNTGRLPPVTARMVPKMEAMSLAIIDFAMNAVSQWVRSGYSQDPEKRPYRAFREVEPMISLLYSIETELISSRTKPLH